MFDIRKPELAELPSLARLRRATVVAADGAVLILVAVVLPAEYGIDPSGAGPVLGLTEMGEIRRELQLEAEQDEDHHTDHSSSLLESLLGLFIGTAHADEGWRDTEILILQPGESAETKLIMDEGQHAQFSWSTAGGRINFDLHAHGAGQSKSYEKGRGKTSGEGSIKAPFSGEHGWFWRNRDKQAVAVTLRVKGNYKKFVVIE